MGKIKNKEIVVKDSELPVYGESEKWRILKNIVVISLAFMLHFTAFQGTANLQSSLNADEGLGTSSLASIYAALILSNMFLPVVIITWCGCKYALVFSFITYMPYIAAQFWPAFYTMIPAGLSVGFGGGPLWVAKCTYLSVFAEAYASITGISAEVLVVRFFGIFFMIFQFSQVWGNLISSLVLTLGNSTVSSSSAINATMVPEVCGANFVASQDAAEAISTQPINEIHMIIGIYLACMVAACILVLVGLDSIDRYNANRKGSGTGLSGLSLLVITMKLLKEPQQLLLIPLTMWLGLGQAFVGADFTSAYVACALGTGRIGFVMICYGVCNSISAVALGSVVKITGRLPVLLGAFLLQTSLIVTLLVWRPQPHEPVVFFIISGLWGVCDGVWLVQVNALCGILFRSREEAAYSNFRLWESLGFIIAYIYSPILRTYIKLYILLGLLIVGILCYTVVEVKHMKMKKEEMTKIKNEQNELSETNLGQVNEGFSKM